MTISVQSEEMPRRKTRARRDAAMPARVKSFPDCRTQPNRDQTRGGRSGGARARAGKTRASGVSVNRVGSDSSVGTA
jgi:hypothetical protein